MSKPRLKITPEIVEAFEMVVEAQGQFWDALGELEGLTGLDLYMYEIDLSLVDVKSKKSLREFLLDHREGI